MFTEINRLSHGSVYPQKTFVVSPREDSIFCTVDAHGFCRCTVIVVKEKEVTGNAVPRSTLQIMAQLNELTVPSF